MNGFKKCAMLTLSLAILYYLFQIPIYGVKRVRLSPLVNLQYTIKEPKFHKSESQCFTLGRRNNNYIVENASIDTS